LHLIRRNDDMVPVSRGVGGEGRWGGAGRGAGEQLEVLRSGGQRCCLEVQGCIAASRCGRARLLWRCWDLVAGDVLCFCWCRPPTSVVGRSRSKRKVSLI
jgi:hypothetical protein